MHRIGLALALFVSLSGANLRADDGKFHPIFNGKDFTGWVTPEDKTLFTVENGEIVGRTKSVDHLKKNEFLATEKPYGDFVLKAKVKLRNGNSGIQFRSTRTDDGVVAGPQADAAEGYWGLLYEERRRGILEQYDPKKAEALIKKNDWNDFVITCKGDHLTIDINGTRVIDRTDPKFDKSGIIALQVHVGPAMEVRYKDLEIKTLD
ncbi:3-keto-disaccharide hydrolase [Singulisphaera sp. PoT]|uniref:3-keto-disaccharide hydrolase n=1 Tax=Singulisphaera sp. PoT TaxID=3411797 RepID=UPI003BF4B054